MGDPLTQVGLENLSADADTDTARFAAFGLALIARNAPSRRLVDLLAHSDEQVSQHASDGLNFSATDWAREALEAATPSGEE